MIFHLVRMSVRHVEFLAKLSSFRKQIVSPRVPQAAYRYRKSSAAPSPVSENRAVEEQTRTGSRNELFFEVPFVSDGLIFWPNAIDDDLKMAGKDP